MVVQSRLEQARPSLGGSSPPGATSSSGVSVSAAGSATSSGVAPAEAQAEPTGGGAQVPSAWGNTQKGKHVSWQRHGIPLAMLLGVLGIGAYWASTLTSHTPPAAPTEGHLSNTPASARPVAAPTPDAPPAVAPATAAQPAAVPAELAPAPAEPASPAPAATPPMTPPATAATTPPAGAPRVSVVPAVAAAATRLPAVPARAAPVKTNRPAEPRPLARPAETPHPAPAAKLVEPASSDKPKADTSSRGVLDVPDFGGRE
jgi:hypothetical protein